MTQDIRLSKEVEEKANENTKLATAKWVKIMDTLKLIMEREFEGQYDETYFLTLYVRKGNDINTLAATQLLLGGCMTPSDSAMIKFFAHNQETWARMEDNEW